MRIAVCCKAVPLEVTPDLVQVTDGQLHCNSGDLFINEFDEYALEAALSLKKSYNAETWAVTVGSLRAQEVLHIALAKGIDKVLRIEGGNASPERLAYGLVTALKTLEPQLILVGVQSEDWMGGEIGAFMAEELGASLGFATIQICELNDTQIRIQKEIGGGRRVETVLKLPAVLCVQSGIQPLQYLSAIRKKKARDIPVKLWGQLDDVDIPLNVKNMHYEVKNASAPETRAQAIMITGDRPEKARKILEIIKKNL